MMGTILQGLFKYKSIGGGNIGNNATSTFTFLMTFDK